MVLDSSNLKVRNAYGSGSDLYAVANDPNRCKSMTNIAGGTTTGAGHSTPPL